MQRKPIIVIFCILLSFVMIILSSQSTSILIKNFSAEKIDQSQEDGNARQIIKTKEWQEFIPTVKTLKRVEVKIKATVGETSSIILSIEQPLGTILSSLELQSSSIPNSTAWVSFDVQDIKLNLEIKYYIVLTVSPYSNYYWYGSDNNPYVNGSSSIGPDWDWCFRTYVDKNKSIFINNVNTESRMKAVSILLFMQNTLKIISYDKSVISDYLYTKN